MEVFFDFVFYFLCFIIVFAFYVYRDFIFKCMINMSKSRTRVFVALGVITWVILLYLKVTDIIEVTWTRTPIMSMIIFIQLITAVMVYFNVFKKSELHNGIKALPMLLLIASTVITTAHLLDTGSYQLVKPGRYDQCTIVDHSDNSEHVYTGVTIYDSEQYTGDRYLFLSYVENGMVHSAGYYESDIEVVCK